MAEIIDVIEDGAYCASCQWAINNKITAIEMGICGTKEMESINTTSLFHVLSYSTHVACAKDACISISIVARSLPEILPLVASLASPLLTVLTA